MNQLVKAHGLHQVVKIVKSQQLHVTRYLSGNPIFVNELRIGINKEGLPKDLRAVIHGVRSEDVQSLRFLFTVFNSHRMILGDGSLAPSSIVLEASSDQITEDSIIE
jgi:hypothetical protein